MFSPTELCVSKRRTLDNHLKKHLCVSCSRLWGTHVGGEMSDRGFQLADFHPPSLCQRIPMIRKPD